MLAYAFLFLSAVALATIVFLLQNANKSGSCEDGLNEENMLVVLRGLIFAGADTTSATVEYGLLYMALHPQVQEKVRAEIHETIGPDRAPSYEDRGRMPYTQAVLNETYRLGSPVPTVAQSTKNSNLWSCALISLYGIHVNESVYDEPHKFKPERFLSTENPSQVINTSNLIPFGYGRRSCPAETAARVAVFIYFVVMLQKYSIRLSSHHPPPSMRNRNGLTRSPIPYYITVAKI